VETRCLPVACSSRTVKNKDRLRIPRITRESYERHRSPGARTFASRISSRRSGELAALLRNHSNLRDPLPCDLLRTHPNLCTLQIADAVPIFNKKSRSFTIIDIEKMAVSFWISITSGSPNHMIRREWSSACPRATFRHRGLQMRAAPKLRGARSTSDREPN
jgi:hypothetical protein